MANASAAGSGGAPDWMGLLQWSLQYQDGTTETKHTPLTDEKREYLEKVFSDMTINEPERLHVITNNLIQYVGENKLHVNKSLQDVFDSRQESVSGDSTVSEDDLEDLLDECEDIVSQIDMADAFVTKYCGLDHLFVILLNKTGGSQEEEVNSNYALRTKVAGIVSLLAQNNEKVQKFMFSASVNVGDGVSVPSLELLLRVYRNLSMIVDDKKNNQRLKLCSKIIYAISGLLSYIPFQKQLFSLRTAAAESDSKGFGLQELILHAINSEYLPLVQRVTVLGESLVGRYKSNRELAAELSTSVWEKAQTQAQTQTASIGGKVGGHEVKVTLDAGGDSLPYMALEDIGAATADAISVDNVLLLAAIFVPTCLKYLNHSIDLDNSIDCADMATRIDLCECSLRLILALSATVCGKAVLRAYTQQGSRPAASSAGSVTDADASASVNSVVVDCLLASVKQHKEACERAKQPGNDHINCEQLTLEADMLKKIVYNILTAS